MNFGGMFHDYRVPKAVLSCIAERGIEATDVATVAARLSRARSSLYRQYGTRQQLLAYAHGRVVASMAGLFVVDAGERRQEFEQWWSQLLEFLRGPVGAPFRVLRRRLDSPSLEDEELAQFPALVQWIGFGSYDPGVVARVRTAWLVLLSAAPHEPDSDEEKALRELVWKIVEDRPAPPHDERPVPT